jgi:hypothetical protein
MDGPRARSAWQRQRGGPRLISTVQRLLPRFRASALGSPGLPLRVELRPSMIKPLALRLESLTGQKRAISRPLKQSLRLPNP